MSSGASRGELQAIDGPVMVPRLPGHERCEAELRGQPSRLVTRVREHGLDDSVGRGPVTEWGLHTEVGEGGVMAPFGSQGDPTGSPEETEAHMVVTCHDLALEDTGAWVDRPGPEDQG
ncbi:hypothetical protein NDU88_001508 [Pleurodeles waltl]|uniref:Uncharacterized protein n=1 Tax=Pleurodeles waltl TaxID=8319 RepID=A0AAV7LXU4_PLEWA|nr:hypothetical protein NDU88_001508 [Pleurodeles waltl]